MRIPLCLCMVLVGCGSDGEPVAAQSAAVVVPGLVAAVTTTPPRHNYEDAPRTPDVDDPAIWEPSACGQKPLVIGTLKHGGLEVYDLDGHIVQSISPQYRPPIGADDPPAPGVHPEAGTSACPGSVSGETFGRFNNVEVVYGFPLRRGHRTVQVDIAVVSDRGCDRLWFYGIDPTRAGGPLYDLTAPGSVRLFPQRIERPSIVQSPGAPVRRIANPVDDQFTAYGLATYKAGAKVRAAVTQEHTSTVALVELKATAEGKIDYTHRAEMHFPADFRVPGLSGRWAPCREELDEDPQLEGMVVDQDHHVLYLSQELIGVYSVDLDDDLRGAVDIKQSALLDTVKSFGAPFWAIPDDGELECASEAPEGALPEGTIVGPGVAGRGGERLEADVEGLSVYYQRGAAKYLLVSSQGSNAYHVYGIRHGLATRYRGAFQVEGVEHTDGLAVTSSNLGDVYEHGFLVVQNGDAPPPASEEPINGYEYDGSAQMMYLRWEDVAAQFDPPLVME